MKQSRFLKLLFVASVFVSQCIADLSAQEFDNRPPGVYGKPWTLFITPLVPPEGKKYSEAFTDACFSFCNQYFDSTTIEPLQLGANQRPEELSRSKSDMVVSCVAGKTLLRGPTCDTLVVWMRQIAGPVNARILVPFAKTDVANIAEYTAQKIFATATEQFLGSVRLKGGPPGLAIQIADGLKVYPPCSMVVPAGTFLVHSTYPQMQPRLDTLTVWQGQTLSKRILMLPME